MRPRPWTSWPCFSPTSRPQLEDPGGSWCPQRLNNAFKKGQSPAGWWFQHVSTCFNPEKAPVSWDYEIHMQCGAPAYAIFAGFKTPVTKVKSTVNHSCHIVETVEMFQTTNQRRVQPWKKKWFGLFSDNI